MADSNYDILRNYFGGQAGPNTGDIAKFIALNASPKDFSGQKVGADQPSVMGRIFDILSRPNYAVAEMTRERLATGDTDLSAFLAGLTGKKKTTFKDVLKQGGMENSVARGALGFALDVGLDPTTYIPVAGIANKLKGAVKGGNVVEDLAKPTQAALLDKGQKIPEALSSKIQESERLLDILPKAGEVKPGSASVGQLQFDLDVIPTAVKKEALVGSRGVTTQGPIRARQLPLKFPDFNIAKERAKVAKEAELAAKIESRAPAKIAQLEAGSIKAAAEMMPLPPPKVTPKHQMIADGILEKWNPSKATAQINKTHPDTLNAKQQVKLWHMAKEAASKNVYKKGRSLDKVAAKVNEEAIKIYSVLERSLSEQGFVPRMGTGDNVKLSDVIADLTLRGKPLDDSVFKEFASELKPGSEAWKSVEVLRARGAVQDAPAVKNVVEKLSETSTAVKTSGVLSQPDQKVLDDFLKKFSKTATQAAGASPAAEKAVRKLVQMSFNSGKSAAEVALEAKSKMLDDVIATGKGRTQVNNITTKALEKDLGKLPAWSVNDNKALEFLMSRVATWWGQSDLRPLSLMAIGASHATAATRGKVLDDLFKPFNEAQRHEAWKVVQGSSIPSTPEVAELASRINVMMENLTSQLGNSVLLKSGVDREMLNKWMREYNVGFTFTNGKAKNLVGESVDYSKGTDWLSSWKTASVVDDPKVFIFKTQQAIEQATREKALFDEIGERFGSVNPGKGYRTKISGHPYLDGYYFTSEIADQIPRVIRDWGPANWKSNSPLLRHYDRVLSMVKSGLTIYRPGHHIRNYIGDVYLGWMDGVNTLRPYQLAAQVQRSMKGAYSKLSDVDQLVALGAAPRTLATPKPNQVLFRNRTGQAFTAEQIAAAAHQRGLLEHVKTLEDLIDMGMEGGQKSILDLQPFGGKVQAVARGASELFSHNTRLAHFIDKVQKSRGDDLPKIFEEAANRSRKWHPTGLDLTDFEKKYMRRIMPFYSWMRKSLPLIIEGLVMNPGKAVIPAKAYDAMQEMAGIDVPGRHDPFPVDQMFPEWIREGGLGPVGLPEGLLGPFSNQEPPGYVMAGMGLNPLTELITQLQNPGKTIASSLTPAVQIPMELITGKKTFTGEPITGLEARDGAFEQWVGEQIPIWSAVQGVTGVTPFGTETGKSKKSGSDAGTEAFMNWLTGGGIRGTGPYVTQARYEKRQPVIMEKRQAKEDFLRMLKDQQGGS